MIKNFLNKITPSQEFTASRVSVWDAEALDKGIYDVLKQQLQTISSYLPAGIITKFEPEVEALLKSVLWILSVEKSFATFGQQLLHLKYETRTPLYKLRVLGILQIGSSYFKEKLLGFLANHRNGNFKEIGMSVIKNLETALKVLDVFSFVVFIRNGGSSTFFEHLLKLKQISTLNPSDRTIGYGFMTRELLWHGLIELLLLVLPLFNFFTIKRLYNKFIKGSKQNQVTKSSYKLTKDTKCPVCKDFPIIPYNMGCTHIFCHFCLSSHRVADKRFECPACGFSDPTSTAMVPVSVK